MYKKSLLLTWKSYVLGMLLVLSSNSLANDYQNCQYKGTDTPRLDIAGLYMLIQLYMQKEVYKMERDTDDIIFSLAIKNSNKDDFIKNVGSQEEGVEMIINEILENSIEKCIYSAEDRKLILHGKRIEYKVGDIIYVDHPVIISLSYGEEYGGIIYQSKNRSASLRALQDKIGINTKDGYFIKKSKLDDLENKL